MNQSLKMFTGIVLLTITISINSMGQESSSSAQALYVANSSQKNLPTSTSKEEADVSASILTPALQSNFTGLFPAAANEKWSSSADHFWVSFVNGGRNTKACFTKKGKLNYIITDCNMAQLPADFSKAINKDYSDYQLFNAIEITAYGAKAYQAVLENAKGFVTLKFAEQTVELIQQVSK